MKMSKKKTKQISIDEYVSKVNPEFFRTNRKNPTANVTGSAIRKRIRKGMGLPDVIKYNKVGKVHILTVNINF